MPFETEAMRAARDARVIQDIETNRTLLVILDRLSKKPLEPDLLCGRNVLRGLVGIVLFVGLEKLFGIVGRDQAGVKRQLSKSSEHT